jgi:hypothetical protein
VAGREARHRSFIPWACRVRATRRAPRVFRGRGVPCRPAANKRLVGGVYRCGSRRREAGNAPTFC